MARKKKRKRRKRPLFRKYYKISPQDDYSVRDEKLLQNIHKELADEVFKDFPFNNIGDWEIQTENLTLFIDPEFGNQLEVQGTSNMPLSKRVIIHSRLLDLIKGGCSLSKAVKMCLSI